MKITGTGTISEITGDFVIFRGMTPQDPRIPSLQAIQSAGQSPGSTPAPLPRKTEPAYATAVVQMLRAARALDQPKAPIQRLILVGDTPMQDGGTFTNLCQAGGWRGMAFICGEDHQPPKFDEHEIAPGVHIIFSSRWNLLPAFDTLCHERDFAVDERTAIVLDIDKTLIGARGRNSSTIDHARVVAVHATVAALLGADFDETAFQTAYQLLNQPQYHPFTTDNQDYLAYICLMLGGGLLSLAGLLDHLAGGTLTSFEAFIALVEKDRERLSSALREIHCQVYDHVRAGDPTPFKTFRRREYLTTTGSMGHLPDHTPVETLLAEEIVITGEVRAAALAWRAKGALIFALSDKPDEASLPTPALAAQGHLPLHRTPTHIVTAA